MEVDIYPQHQGANRKMEVTMNNWIMSTHQKTKETVCVWVIITMWEPWSIYPQTLAIVFWKKKKNKTNKNPNFEFLLEILLHVYVTHSPFGKALWRPDKNMTWGLIWHLGINGLWLMEKTFWICTSWYVWNGDFVNYLRVSQNQKFLGNLGRRFR